MKRRKEIVNSWWWHWWHQWLTIWSTATMLSFFNWRQNIASVYIFVGKIYETDVEKLSDETNKRKENTKVQWKMATERNQIQCDTSDVNSIRQIDERFNASATNWKWLNSDVVSYRISWRQLKMKLILTDKNILTDTSTERSLTTNWREKGRTKLNDKQTTEQKRN